MTSLLMDKLLTLIQQLSFEEFAKANQFTISILSAAGTWAAVCASLWYSIAESRRGKRNELRKQAELVTAWVVDDFSTQQDGKMYLQLHITNASDQLLYNVVAIVVHSKNGFRVRDTVSQEYGYFALFGNLPPGGIQSTINFGGHGMHIQFRVEVAFQDSAGNNWIRHADGDLRKIKKSPLAHYDLSEPAAWRQPQRLNKNV